MGWLFGKKKPQVPFPAGRPLGEGELRLPGKAGRERIIEPERLKAAAGLEQPLPFEEETEELSLPEETVSAPPGKMPFFRPPKKKPLYVKVDVYQRLLGEMEAIKGKVTELQEINRKLESSEYNEENNFAQLRRAVRNMHDHLLVIDKMVFKSAAE